MAWEGPAGRLEGELSLPDEAGPRALCVVAHPHPLHGGNMHSSVVYRVARGMKAAGVAALRFNFRGVGTSAGTHDGGQGELDDMRSACDWLAAERPGLPLWGAGFSFGARAALMAAGEDERLARALLVALPVKAFECPGLEGLSIPSLVLQAENDEFGNQDAVRELYPNLPRGVRTACVRGTDHFFTDRLDALEQLVRETAESWLEEYS